MAKAQFRNNSFFGFSKILLTSLGIALSVSSTQAQEAILDLPSAQQSLANIQRQITPETVIQLPVNGFNAIDLDGQLNFISDTGRFVIMGQLYDVLAQDFIVSPDDLRDVTERINFSKLKIDFDDLNTFNSGNPTNPMVVSFVDPTSKASLESIADMEKLNNDYYFRYVPVPVLGESANNLNKKLACATDREAAFNALKKGKIEQLNAPMECDNQKNDLTLLTAHMLQISGVPFTVAPNGSVARGYIQNLEPWLRDNISNSNNLK